MNGIGGGAGLESSPPFGFFIDIIIGGGGGGGAAYLGRMKEKKNRSNLTKQKS